MMDDDLSYHLRFDKDFIENMPADFFAKIVTFPQAIPDLFAGFIKRYNPTLGKERHDFLDYHKEIVDEMQELRFTERQLREEYNDHHDSEYVQQHLRFPLLRNLTILRTLSIVTF